MSTVVSCVGCGRVLCAGPLPTAAALEHVRTCPKHPLAEELRLLRFKLRTILNRAADPMGALAVHAPVNLRQDVAQAVDIIREALEVVRE